MVRQDTITVGFTLVAGLIAVYLGTYEKSFVSIFPAILLVISLVFQLSFLRKTEDPDTDVDNLEIKQITFYTALSFIGISVMSLVVSYLPATVGMSALDAQLYGVLMAVSEEQFFRGFITSFILSLTKSRMLALAGSAGVFTVYHFNIYGANPEALLYVFLAGTILTWITLKTNRLSPAILAHTINNLLSVG